MRNHGVVRGNTDTEPSVAYYDERRKTLRRRLLVRPTQSPFLKFRFYSRLRRMVLISTLLRLWCFPFHFDHLYVVHNLFSAKSQYDWQ